MQEKRSVRNSIVFIGGTLLGILLVLIPFNFNGTVDTVLFYYLKLLINQFNAQLRFIIMVLMILSAVGSLYDAIVKPKFIRNNKILKNILSTSPFYIVNRFLGALICVLVYFKIGPEFIISADTGSSMFGLATQLSVLVPFMLLLQTFILECGAMEFLGELIGFVVKPIFKISEMGAVSIISAWVGPGNAAILATQNLFEEGYYTVKEAAIIGSQFSTSSVGWIVLVSSVFGIMDHFVPLFLVITLVGVIVAMVGVRIPPISNYPDTYVDGSTTSPVVKEENVNQSKLTYAYNQALKRADKVTLKNFTSKINNMLFYVMWLQPIIVCWGTLALITSIYTPILQWISYPIELILNAANISEPAASASAIMSGFADNYLPVILGKDIVSVESRFIIAAMSILQIVFMSEIASLLTSTKVVKSFKDVLMVFIVRTFIALPFVILCVKLLGLS
ncbi:YjiH family protein [Erysipelothrix urinaevulpis]|uniref:YjiH family protein n=1 Tax=Erysipelothrix urinaevulpis TaxID=2683717 RepID=UPI00135CB35F|nr:arginine transporter [Erysipelothrix urinaevulpis]